MASAAKAKQQEGLGEGAVMGLTITAFCIALCMSGITLFVSLTGKKALKYIASHACCLVCESIFFLIVWILISGQAKKLESRQEAIESLEFVNDCGD